MTKDKERDDALIAEKRKLSDVLEAITRLGTVDPWRGDLLRAAALLRGDEQTKPDRAEVCEAEIWAYTGSEGRDFAVSIIRRHFDELRAEWEAEQEVVPRDVAESWKARADNLKEDRENLLSNLAIMMSKHVENWPEPRRFSTAIALLDKTLTEALTKREAERPAVVVPNEEQIKQMVTRFLGWRLPEDFRPDDGISFEPEFNKEWNASQGKPPQRRTPTGTNLFNYTQAEAMVRYMIDGAKGGE